MSKAFVISKVIQSGTAEGKPHTIAVVFSKDSAEKAKVADMRDSRSQYSDDNIFTYDEDEGAIVFREGDETAIQWNIEEVDIRLPLTPLQFTNLNLLTQNIANGKGDFFSYEDDLSDEETAYLIDKLDRTYKVLVLPKEGLQLTGSERDKWIAEHGKEGK